MATQYWKGLEELREDAEFVKNKHNEFPEPLPVEKAFSKMADDPSATSRRDFLKFLGFSVTAASLAACEAPVNKTIPYLVKPEEVIPGSANWYASTYADGQDYCSILVKTREGRPIKIEGNEKSSVTKGGISARVAASVLSLYDSSRLSNPIASGKPISWEDADKQIKTKLEAIAAKGGKIRIVSSSVVSPSTSKVIADFIAKYPTAKQVVYDAVSSSAIINANQWSFEKATVPSYRFDKAALIVSFNADFLGNWLSPVEFSKQYAVTRKLGKDKKSMSRHIQFETLLSLTGSNADERIRIKSSQEGAILLNLYNTIASASGASPVIAPAVKFKEQVDKAAKELLANKGKSLVVCGTNNTHHQVIVNAINAHLESYGNTIDLDNPSNMQQSNDAAVAELMNDLKSGVDAVIFYNTNPVYTMPKSADAFKKAGLKISLSDREDETASICDFVCPDHHYLEAWNDAEPKKGMYSLAQPTIAPLYKTRAAQESILKWAGNDSTYLSYIQNYWKENIFPKQSGQILFDSFWNTALQEGVFELPALPPQAYKITKDLASPAQAIGSSSKESEVEVVLYQKMGIGNGNQSNNPWLQEMPDPVSRVSWDNYATLSPAFAAAKGIEQNNWVTVTANGATEKLPAYIMPGQADGTIGIALGYGRTKAGKAGNNVGKNGYVFSSADANNIIYSAAATVAKADGEEYQLACSQTHHTMMGRDIVKETTLANYIKDPKSGNPDVLVHTSEGKKKASEVNLWDDHDKPLHLWGMTIDLNSCIGCGACVISCQSENNVAVVGKEEVGLMRDMHWIRIDRYFSSDMSVEEAKAKDIGKIDMWRSMEKASENPGVTFQPVMCQHCNHAPCETVCPVNATNHSSDGLNQMAYNRCVGTRYCANNCPYKVRRFNWFKYADNELFDYHMNDKMGKMVLNPDVIVRGRGVMEKCSLCVQQIQEGRLNAKKQNRRVIDGEIKTACAQSCPTNAITFGDWNDKNSAISLQNDERAYHLLEELDVQPNIMYLTKVRNKA